MVESEIVLFKIINNNIVAEPSQVIVTQSQTYITFQLLIPGLSFADPDPSAGVMPIRVSHEFDYSFRGPWKLASNTAGLLDLYSVFDPVPYAVWVVNAAGRRYPLGFRIPPTILNKMP